MKISVICFSLTGQQTGLRLTEELSEKGMETVLAWKSKYLPDSISEGIGSWTGKQFQDADGIIFIGACGIAVRSIAPYVAGKKTDPAVLVIDECGKFVISLLSGHLGGANELALLAAEILHATPVVTTATDLHQRFAVDVFAKKNNCAIFHMKAAKEASAALLAGKTVGFYSEFPWDGRLPEGLAVCDENGLPVPCTGEGNIVAEGWIAAKAQVAAEGMELQRRSSEKPEVGIAVTLHRHCLPFASTVQVVPSVVSLGMGCRREKEAEAVLSAAEDCLKKNDIYREAVCSLASISLKKDEQGFLSLAEKWGIPFQTFEEAELLSVPGEFTPSPFVKKITGVDNVCERSAVLASAQGNLIQKKIGGNGVTIALAVRDWRIQFE
ncbi:MAG: cobalt-precorrin 5A hydrolase [Eubacteriales bacterium]|nr:cobalt-precorrin 5A hydrolase [Eubacteriales bacterium]